METASSEYSHRRTHWATQHGHDDDVCVCVGGGGSTLRVNRFIAHVHSDDGACRLDAGLLPLPSSAHSSPSLWNDPQRLGASAALPESHLRARDDEVPGIIC